jgi:hypothetical protein
LPVEIFLHKRESTMAHSFVSETRIPSTHMVCDRAREATMDDFDLLGYMSMDEAGRAFDAGF